MTRYSKRQGEKPTASLAAKFLEESIRELALLNKEFDRGNTLAHRTMSVVCSRIFEELSVIDPDKRLRLLSLSGAKFDTFEREYVNYIVASKTGLPGKQLISFRPHPVTTEYRSPADLNDDLFIDGRQWRSAKIFSSTKSKNDAISRQDLIRFIRNFSGAHLVRQSAEFGKKMKAKVPSLSLAGGINTDDPSKEDIFYNSPFPSLLRTFSEEIRISLQTEEVKSMIDKHRKEEPDLLKFDCQKIEYHVEFLPWGTARDLGADEMSVKVCDRITLEKRSGMLVGSTSAERGED